MSRSQPGSRALFSLSATDRLYCSRIDCQRTLAQLNPMKVPTAPEIIPSTPPGAATPVLPCSMRELLLYFLRLGALGFGGPIALAGYMQRDLVERRRWISKEDYVQGLALAQLAPGPLAAQLAMYLGWVKARVRGATLVSLAFILPSF